MVRSVERLDVEQCNCFALRKAARRVTRFYDDALAGTGLRITQFQVLALLSQVGRAPIGEIADRTDMERTAAGKTIGLLERMDLIAVTPDPSDGRGRIVSLTSAGKASLAHAAPLWRKAQDDLSQWNGVDPLDNLRARLSDLRLTPEIHD